MRLLDELFFRANRIRNRFSRRRYPAANVLLLLPHCLQNRQCEVRLTGELLRCKMCGRCPLRALRALAERRGVQAYVAAGGREALARARADDVRAVLAVACKRELAEGIRGAFPRKVVDVLNTWPHGACTDTDVDVAAVERALDELIEPQFPQPKTP